MHPSILRPSPTRVYIGVLVADDLSYLVRRAEGKANADPKVSK